MNKEIIVRWSVGSFDWAHPQERQCNVYFTHPQYGKLNLSLPEDFNDEIRREDWWSEVLEKALELYIEKTLWSSTLVVAEKLLKDLKTNEELRDEIDYAYALEWMPYFKREEERMQEMVNKMDKLIKLIGGKDATETGTQ